MARAAPIPEPSAPWFVIEQFTAKPAHPCLCIWRQHFTCHSSLLDPAPPLRQRNASSTPSTCVSLPPLTHFTRPRQSNAPCCFGPRSSQSRTTKTRSSDGLNSWRFVPNVRYPCIDTSRYGSRRPQTRSMRDRQKSHVVRTHEPTLPEGPSRRPVWAIVELSRENHALQGKQWAARALPVSALRGRAVWSVGRDDSLSRRRDTELSWRVEAGRKVRRRRRAHYKALVGLAWQTVTEIRSL